jgi:hypothetical protein
MSKDYTNQVDVSSILLPKFEKVVYSGLDSGDIKVPKQFRFQMAQHMVRKAHAELEKLKAKLGAA